MGTVLIAAIVPANDAPSVFASDKLNHILAFLVLSFLAKILWPQTKIAILFGLLATLGGGIELMQMSLGFGRDADLMDFAADLFAIALGLVAAYTVIGLSRNSTFAEK